MNDTIRELPNPFEEGTCFFCGPQNPSGLKLKFFHDLEAGEIFAHYTAEAAYCGQKDLLHGGMLMGLLDEAMWWAGFAATGLVRMVTVEAKFRLLRPVYIGDTIRIACTMKSFEDPNMALRGRILNPEGKVCTTVSGTYRVLGKEQYQKLVSGRR